MRREYVIYNSAHLCKNGYVNYNMCCKRKEVGATIEFFYILIVLAYICVIMITFMGFMYCDFTYFSYKANYERWNKLNWFGIVFITSVLCVLYFPLSIGYDICRFIRWIFTVGRKD